MDHRHSLQSRRRQLHWRRHLLLHRSIRSHGRRPMGHLRLERIRRSQYPRESLPRADVHLLLPGNPTDSPRQYRELAQHPHFVPQPKTNHSHSQGSCRTLFCARLYAIGGLRNPPVAASIFAATASTASSSQGLPTICTPIGKPSAERPTGTTAAGFPSKLNHCE